MGALTSLVLLTAGIAALAQSVMWVVDMETLGMNYLRTFGAIGALVAGLLLIGKAVIVFVESRPWW